MWLGQCSSLWNLRASPWCRFHECVPYDGNDSRLLQVSSDGSGSLLTYGAAGFVESPVASWGSADDSSVSFSGCWVLLLMVVCFAAGGVSAGVPEFRCALNRCSR